MLEMKYFVLKPRAKSRNDAFASASQYAMETYAIEIADIDKELSEALTAWVNAERKRQDELD